MTDPNPTDPTDPSPSPAPSDTPLGSPSGSPAGANGAGPAAPLRAHALLSWNLRQLRVERALSQEGLALAAGIDRSYVGRVERGTENVTVTVLEALATALAVPVGRLFAEPEPGADPPRPLRAGRKAKGAVPGRQAAGVGPAKGEPNATSTAAGDTSAARATTSDSD